MNMFIFLVFPALTIAGIALGLVLYLIKQMKNMEEKIKELESKHQ